MTIHAVPRPLIVQETDETTAFGTVTSVNEASLTALVGPRSPCKGYMVEEFTDASLGVPFSPRAPCSPHNTIL